MDSVKNIVAKPLVQTALGAFIGIAAYHIGETYIVTPLKNALANFIEKRKTAPSQ